MEETIMQRKDSETLGSGATRVAVVLGVGGILIGLLMLIGSVLGGANLVMALVITIVLPIALIILGLIFWLLYTGISFVAALIVGGKGSFGQHAGVSTLIVYPLVVIGIVLSAVYLVSGLFMIIPILGLLIVFMVFAIIWMVSLVLQYLLNYFQIVFLKAVHNISTLKAALSIGITILIILILCVLLVLVMWAVLFPFIGSLMNPIGLAGLV